MEGTRHGLETCEALRRMYELTVADPVWNRAAMEAGGPEAREGDLALAALLSIHSLATNGGLLHSVESHDSRAIERGTEGFRYFGLLDAAEAVGWVVNRVAATDLDADTDAAEQLESEADLRYGQAVPTDSTLVTRFEEIFAERSEAFAPLG